MRCGDNLDFKIFAVTFTSVARADAHEAFVVYLVALLTVRSYLDPALLLELVWFQATAWVICSEDYKVNTRDIQ